MKYRIYSIYDQKAEMHNFPMFVKMEGEALRAFADACNNPEHQYGRHPEDYLLTFLGEYDDELGTIEQKEIKHLTNGLGLLKPVKEDK